MLPEPRLELESHLACRRVRDVGDGVAYRLGQRRRESPPPDDGERHCDDGIIIRGAVERLYRVVAPILEVYFLCRCVPVDAFNPPVLDSASC